MVPMKHTGERWAPRKMQSRRDHPPRACQPCGSVGCCRGNASAPRSHAEAQPRGAMTPGERISHSRWGAPSVAGRSTGCFLGPGLRTATSALWLTSTRRNEPLPRPGTGAEREHVLTGGSPRRLLPRQPLRFGGREGRHLALVMRHASPPATCPGPRRPSLLTTPAERGRFPPRCRGRREARRGTWSIERDPAGSRAGIRAPKRRLQSRRAPSPPTRRPPGARRTGWGHQSRLGDPSPQTNAGSEGAAWVSAGRG